MKATIFDTHGSTITIITFISPWIPKEKKYSDLNIYFERFASF